MSSDNFIEIYPEEGEWYVEEKTTDDKIITNLGSWADLESAVRAANAYMEENEVEFGLSIKI